MKSVSTLLTQTAGIIWLALSMAAVSVADDPNANPMEAAKTAAQKAREEVTAAEKALSAAPGEPEKAAAEKTLKEKTAVLREADAAVRAQEAYAADKAVESARNALTKAAEAAREAKDPETKKSLESETATASESLGKALEQAAVARAAAAGGLKPVASGAWSCEKARHLLFRAGFGGPPEEVARLHGMGLFAAVDHLVDYHLQPETAGWFDAFPHQRSVPWEKHLNAAQRAELSQAAVNFRQNQHHRMRRAWLERMATTRRPLQEKLTLFWHGHFACSFLAGEDSYAMWQQNEMFRHMASGNFGALLNGIAHDPAMIRYLDNNQNFKGAGNENLGREILELFSMGEGRGYTEQDLAEAARALTGYNFEYHNGQFKFIASRHDDGEKTLFGKKGNFGGDELVDLILKQPATSHYIAGKLFRFFAHDNPTAETIEQMASMLRTFDNELKPMLRNLFQSEEFYSERAMGTHIKSPVELAIGAVRTLKLANVDFNALDNTVSNLGQRLMEPPNVAGWEGGRAWIDASSLLQRYNAVAQLVESADLIAWAQTGGTADPAVAVDYLAKALLCVPLSEPKRQALIAHLGPLPPPEQWAEKRKEINTRLRDVLVALVSLPEYQLAQSAPAPVRQIPKLAALTP